MDLMSCGVTALEVEQLVVLVDTHCVSWFLFHIFVVCVVAESPTHTTAVTTATLKLFLCRADCAALPGFTATLSSSQSFLEQQGLVLRLRQHYRSVGTPFLFGSL